MSFAEANERFREMAKILAGGINVRSQAELVRLLAEGRALLIGSEATASPLPPEPPPEPDSEEEEGDDEPSFD